MAKLNPQRLIFGLFLIVVIVVAEVLFGALKLHGWLWPAFIVMIFFFEAHMDIKKAPNIIVGGLFGLFGILIAKYVFVVPLAPTLGEALPRLIFIVVFVYAIVAFGEMLPILFNNYAFMNVLVTAIAIKQKELPNSNPDVSILIWMGVELVVGVTFIYAILGIIKILGAMAKRKAAK
ncbi:MAG: hypothetical protein A2176_12535 [Spirochaetes bacterium RBG_13_51_14]|nr:MAG: hypothetical protein A2176_12535 [Spirochaetes bacterium RBG_13_51_14]